MRYSKVNIRKFKRSISVKEIIQYTMMFVLVTFMMLPLIYLVVTAFKPLKELFIYPPRFYVKDPTFDNFEELVIAMDSTVVPFTRYVFNSLFTTILSVGGSVIVCSMGAYAIEKHKPFGHKVIFTIIISALMFSPQVTQIPNYMVVQKLGLINTYWALIIPKLAVPMNFFLMKQFMTQIPNTYIEAARIDGAKEWHTFWKLIMPMAKAAWATLIVFSFVANWNDAFSPMVYITSQAMKTLPLALSTIAGGPGNIARVGATYAATLLTTLPTIIIFIMMQSKVIKTMAHSGIKG